MTLPLGKLLKRANISIPEMFSEDVFFTLVLLILDLDFDSIDYCTLFTLENQQEYSLRHNMMNFRPFKTSPGLPWWRSG